MKVLVIIPVYNESASIEQIIRDIHSQHPKYHILVINDASTDESEKIVERTGLARLVNLPYNLGIGGAVQTGFIYARDNNYDIALQFDGDGQHKVEEIDKLVKMIKKGKADVVIGSRFNKKSEGFTTHPLRRVGIRIFQLASYLMIRQRITDHTSGFRAFNRRAFCFLADNYPTDYPEPEVVILLGRNRFVMKEVFTQMMRRQGGVSSIHIAKGPYYMTKVLLAMFMASIRSRIISQNIKC
ncbi:MAG TPA: glycosyltransferase family 2 protein [Bacteroidales bacterium]|nr:glycosyltransferase family 2 protein [Bacteroidales bacterium]